jgi:hypothetical protein
MIEPNPEASTRYRHGVKHSAVTANITLLKQERPDNLARRGTYAYGNISIIKNRSSTLDHIIRRSSTCLLCRSATKTPLILNTPKTYQRHHTFSGVRVVCAMHMF